MKAKIQQGTMKQTLQRDLSHHFDENRTSRVQLADIDVARMNALHFTESDRRTVMNKFIRNKEIMFLIFGLMFPYKTLQTAKKEAAELA